MPESDPPTTAGTDPGTSGSPDGRATRWAGQAERRRAEFVDAALAAIAEYGAEVTTEQIAARAGVARTRLYRHFDGAGDLNRAIAARAEAMVLDNFAPLWDPRASPEQIIRGAVSAHLAWMTEHHRLYDYLTRHAVLTGSGSTVVSDVKQLIAGLVAQLLEGVVVALDIDARLAAPLAAGLVGFVDGAAERWVDAPRDLGAEEVVDLLSRLIWGSLDGFLRGEGVALDPTAPLADLLAAGPPGPVPPPPDPPAARR